MTVRCANFYWCLDIQWTIGPTNLELMGVIWAGYRTSLMIQKWVFATWIIFIFDTAMLAFLQTHESQRALGLPNHFRFGLLLAKPGSSSCISVFVPMKIFFSFLLLWTKANAYQISGLLATASEKNKSRSVAYLSTIHLQLHSSPEYWDPKSEKKVVSLMSFDC